jgi:DUF1009 family protein
MTKKIAIISGKGELPSLIAIEAEKKGYDVLVIALDPVADLPDNTVANVEHVNIGKLGKLIKTMKDAGIHEAVMAGKAPKSLIYKGRILPDLHAMKLLFSLKDRKDDTILQAITDEIESNGIKVLRITDLAHDLIMPGGVITKRRPSSSEMKDIEFGFGIAKEIGRLDIGQTVVVKDRAVMAVEAIEGTDEAILRGGALAGGGAVVIKVSKPQQDMRFDVPATGIGTLNSMIKAGASVLALEAERSLIIRKEKMKSLAEKHGISIIGVKPQE